MDFSKKHSLQAAISNADMRGSQFKRIADGGCTRMVVIIRNDAGQLTNVDLSEYYQEEITALMDAIRGIAEKHFAKVMQFQAQLDDLLQPASPAGYGELEDNKD